MKKVFLLFGIAAFVSASAQQNELFDIQKHLLNKQAEENKLVENKTLTIPFNNRFITRSPDLNNNPIDSYYLPNGDKVIICPLDNMPCVVPDMSMFQAMPNSGYDKNYNSPSRQKLPGDIPNGAILQRINISK